MCDECICITFITVLSSHRQQTSHIAGDEQKWENGMEKK